MDYKKCYDRIIGRRKAFPLTEEEYGERHHIVPRSLNGTNSSFNIVKLTAREHFICHALLAEIYEKGTVEWHKMNHAFLMMKAGLSKKPRYFNSRLYELKREDFSETMKFVQSGCKNSQYGKIWVYHTDLEKSVVIQEGLLDHYLSLGYRKGRVLNFERFKKELENVSKRESIRAEKYIQAKKEAEYWLACYKASTYPSISKFVKGSEYSHSVVNLTLQWKKYIPGYKDFL